MTIFDEHPLRMTLLRATVLLCGAVGMIFELVGSRLLAPYFGNGLFVWTALIGIMLGFMSLGNYLGGRVADRHLSVSVLFWILMASSAGIAVVSFLEPVLLPPISAALSVKVAAVTAAIVLFGAGCTALGMVTPYTTRYSIQSVDGSGSTMGSLYALGTLGSIIGTFLGGFYLIAAVGSHALIAYLAIVPLILALFFAFAGRRPDKRQLVGIAVVMAVVALSFVTQASALDRLAGAFGPGTRVTSSFDTTYDRYMVIDSVDSETGRPIRYLARDFESAESAVFSDNGEPVIFDYYRYYDLTVAAADQVSGGLGSTLIIGGGTFSYPRHQVQVYPGSTTDAIEIDPALVDVAREQFFLQDDDRINIITEDGRTFLNRAADPEAFAAAGGDAGATSAPYDVVLIDAFKSANSIPYQLTTLETMRSCYELLDDDGFIVMNIIASPEGAGSRFVSAQFETISQVFEQVNLYAVYDMSETEVVQNISIVATKAPRSSFDLSALLGALNPELAARRLDPASLPKAFVLTDDHAPADQLLKDI